MVILIRCNDIVSDPRAMKYVRYLQENGIEHKLIGWDRDNCNPKIANSVFWTKKAKYNVGGFCAVKNRVLWMWFVYKQLKKYKTHDATLHGCDLDSAFPAAIYKLFHPSCNLIFDVFDWFSATLYNQKKYILLAFKAMERFTTKMSNKIIICEEERVEQIPFKVESSKICVLPNIPFFNDDKFLKKDQELYFNNDKLTFSYVGGFSNDRCLFEILNIAEKGLINLSIAGYGLPELEKKLQEASARHENIRYHGKVDYKIGLNISFNSDIMFAMYSPVNPNNVYAAPNKYYEAMFLGKPLFSSKGTIVEKKVTDRQMGYLAFDNEEDIKKVIQTIDRNELLIKGNNSKSCWQKTYKDYTSSFMDTNYKEMIEIKIMRN